MNIIVGTYEPLWGHTFAAQGSGKFYALRNLAERSSLCVFDREDLAGQTDNGIIMISALDNCIKEIETGGVHSCHMTLLDNQIVISNYTSGTLSLFSIDEEGLPCGIPETVAYDGGQSTHVRQDGPHIHSSVLSPDGGLMLVTDLGTDRIYIYKVEDGRVVLPHVDIIQVPDACGPRMCVFSHDGRYLYVATELSDEVLVYRMSDKSLLQRILVNPCRPNRGGHIALSNDGRHLYVSSRISGTHIVLTSTVPDGIAVLEVMSDGRLAMTGYSPTEGHPYHFVLTDDGRLAVSCRDSDSILIYKLNAMHGMPERLEKRVSVTKPVFSTFI